MIYSVRLSAEEKAVLKRAAAALRISRSEFVRRSVGVYASEVLQAAESVAQIDALYIGRGGGLRRPRFADVSIKRAMRMRLLEKHGRGQSASREDLSQCPCCGSRTLGKLDSYEICDVCGREDDPIQSADSDYAGGANHESLNSARQKWQQRPK